MERLISLAGEGKLKPVIDCELPLEQAADAHRATHTARSKRGRPSGRSSCDLRGRGVQKLCQSPRIGSSNSIRRRLGFAGLSGIDQPGRTLGRAADGSSAFDVDPADLIFARARETT